jgi:ketosteroid isomerase-like protein
VDAETAAVADKIAIRELTARYNYAIDDGRVDEWVATFTEDGTFESSLLGKHTGKEALRAFGEGYSAAFTGRHCTTDHVVDLDGDRARQRCYLVLVNNDGGSRVSTTAVYEDELRRTPNGWRFTNRRVVPDTELH